jgi:hypothetical protein
MLKMHRAERLAWIKPVAGMVLLAAVIGWIARHEEIAELLDARVLLCSTIISIATVGLNAWVLTLSVAYFRGRLSTTDALRLSALGTIGNTLGGLPIGTTLKYALLYKKSGLKIGEITAGLIFFSVLTCAWLIVCAVLVSHDAAVAPPVKWLVFVAALVFPSAVAAAAWWLRRHRRWAPLVRPLWRRDNLVRGALVSLGITATFIANYTVVCLFLFPQTPIPLVMFVAAIGTIISMGSVLQTVGGVTELSMGLSALLSGVRAVTGATLALALRFSAILAAVAVLSILMLVTKNQRKDA